MLVVGAGPAGLQAAIAAAGAGEAVFRGMMEENRRQIVARGSAYRRYWHPVAGAAGGWPRT